MWNKSLKCNIRDTCAQINWKQKEQEESELKKCVFVDATGFGW